MSPPRALPCEKIHPFYLHRYFCVTTLVSIALAISALTPSATNCRFLIGLLWPNVKFVHVHKSVTTFLAILLATFASASTAAPGDFDTSFGNGGVLDLSAMSNRRIPVPNLNSFTPGSGKSLAFGADGKVYVGGGFPGASFVARVLRVGTLDRSFSADGVLLRSGFLAR